jgi:Flp pilus assembly protein TadG
MLTDNRGVTAIEFAICAPIVFIFVIATVELSADMMLDSMLQAVTQSAARAGLTNVTPASGTRADYAKSIITKGLSGWLSLPNTTLSITETSYSSYGAMSTSSGTAGLGGWGDAVAYQVTVTTPGLTGLPKFFGFSPMTFSRNFIVQNEK